MWSKMVGFRIENYRILQSKVEEETSSAGEKLVRNRLYDYTAGKECFGAPFFIPAGNLYV